MEPMSCDHDLLLTPLGIVRGRERYLWICRHCGEEATCVACKAGTATLCSHCRIKHNIRLRADGFDSGGAVAFGLMGMAEAIRGMWLDRQRRIFEPGLEECSDAWYCIECGARQDSDPVGRDDVWHCKGCSLA